MMCVTNLKQIKVDMSQSILTVRRRVRHVAFWTQSYWI